MIKFVRISLGLGYNNIIIIYIEQIIFDGWSFDSLQGERSLKHETNSKILRQ
jgi:hypothetical protein